MAIRRYQLVITTEGLVHVGSGKSYGKADYFKNGKSLAVLDVTRFVDRLDESQLRMYCSYLQDGIPGRASSESGLEDFLAVHPDLREVAKGSIAYQVDSTLERTRRGTYRYLDVQEFVKDPYGCPFIPGSSVKGAIRTALLGCMILDSRGEYEGLYDRELARSSRKRDQARADRAITKKAFARVHPDSSDCEVVNDIMGYISVSDSKPLSPDALVFAQKYDKFSRGDDGGHKKDVGKAGGEDYREGNSLNIYRECLRPGTEIELTVDIDDRIDGYLGGISLDAEGLHEALTRSFDLYDRCFLSHFDLEEGAGAEGGAGEGDGRCRYIAQSGPLAGSRCRNNAVSGTGYCNKHQDCAAQNSQGSHGEKAVCYLGGGVDFSSKTVVNAVFQEDGERLNEASRILYAQFPSKIAPGFHLALRREIEESGFEVGSCRVSEYGGRLKKAKEDHRHWLDSAFGVAPHTLKMGKWNGRRYPMGRCTVEIREAR